MIRIRDLKKSFDNQAILKGIDLDVKKGQTVAIIGPSGSGKTTFLRCLNFLEYADSGQMQLGELDINFKTASKQEILQVRRSTAMVFQQYNLFANFSVLENITEGLVTARGVNKEQANQRAHTLLDQVGLADYANYYPSQLSGGQQQRVGIARALALQPEVILFDEPTSALDPELVGEVLEIIRAVAESGSTLIIVTHEINFAYEVADEIVFMADGRVVEKGHPQDLIDHPQEKRTQEFLQKTKH